MTVWAWVAVCVVAMVFGAVFVGKFIALGNKPDPRHRHRPF